MGRIYPNFVHILSLTRSMLGLYRVILFKVASQLLNISLSSDSAMAGL